MPCARIGKGKGISVSTRENNGIKSRGYPVTVGGAFKGISTGAFSEALEAILGEKASGLSATNLVRLKVGWEEDYKLWCQRDLTHV
jgi:hypothetical protein